MHMTYAYDKYIYHMHMLYAYDIYDNAKCVGSQV